MKECGRKNIPQLEWTSFPVAIFNACKKSDDYESRELFLLSNKSIRKIRLPQINGKAWWYSSCGWLLTGGKDFASQLINPLSREIINLPKIDTFLEAILPIKWEYPISKVVLLLESKLVLIIWEFKKLGFCHIGDNKWTSVEHGLDDYFIYDVTFYNGQVYTFDLSNTIRACDVNEKDRAVLVHIVGLDDGERKQLLVIIEYLMCKEEIYYTKSFKVFAYDLESGNWLRVTDFGLWRNRGGYDVIVGNHEASKLFPTNPYSATKAAAEMLVTAYGWSNGLPGEVGHVYNIRTKRERGVIDVAKDMCKLFNMDANASIMFVENRGCLEDRSQLLSDIQTIKPTHVFNATGVTGRPKIGVNLTRRKLSIPMSRVEDDEEEEEEKEKKVDQQGVSRSLNRS
nr:hypothetical protein [Tanacetum cinerariifolium]